MVSCRSWLCDSNPPAHTKNAIFSCVVTLKLETKEGPKRFSTLMRHFDLVFAIAN